MGRSTTGSGTTLLGIIQRWENEGRRADVRIARTALTTLMSRNARLVENLDEDGNLPESRKEILLSNLLRVDPEDAIAVEQVYASSCYSNQGAGRLRRDLIGRPLGHVTTRKKLERVLECPRSFRVPLTPGRPAARRLDELMRRDLASQRRALGTVPLSTYQMWSFFVHRYRGDPFEKVAPTDAELRRVLGLGHVPPTDALVFFAHAARENHEPRTPTAFDACWNAFFRPGGRPRPLAGRGSAREVVHRPTRGADLLRPIRQSS